MFKSIRWTLQLWHAAILALALSGFGMATYYGSNRAKYAEVDAELAGLVHSIATKLGPPNRPPPPHLRGSDDPNRPDFDPRPPRDDRRPEAGRPDDGHPDDRRPDQPPPEDRPPEDRRPGDRFNRELLVPAGLFERFGNGHDDEPYLVVWRANGALFKSTVTDVEVPDPGREGATPEPARFRRRADLREAYLLGPQQTRIVVGRSTRRQEGELYRLALLLAATGAGILAIGLAGGWVLSTRAVKPIHSITTTAAAISASSLSGRIDTTGTASELGALARVLNAMFDRLEASFQQQSRFTADASHELRTPLAVIHSHAELALSRDRTAEEYRRTIETCLRASGRMSGLIDSLLLLARADAGKLELDYQPIDLGQITEESLFLLRPLAEEKSVIIEADLPPTPLTGDPIRLAQVVTNLLSNAIRYNCDGGKVRITLTSDGHDATLIVADTGVGIEEADRAQVFDRFFRVDKHRNREAGGSGLGLAICKTIVEAHDGSISTSRGAEGETVFSVRLPATQSEK